ncbi:MAG: hypothetical protein HY301_15765 [Verrucomicrobia bacterium]|nr:hypothetical protein [Verrucomicrobiota bacterium]
MTFSSASVPSIRKASLAVVAALLVLLAFALALGLRRPSGEAFPHARRIGLAVDWSRPELQRFVWLNTNEILFVRAPDACVLNVATGSEKIFTPLRGVFPPGGRDTVRWTARPSPDGRLLLVSTATNRSGGGPVRLVSLPDGEVRLLRPMSLRNTFWYPDSSGWISVEPAESGGMNLRRFDRTGREVSVALHTNQPNTTLHGVGRDGLLLGSRESLMGDPRQRDLVPLNPDPAGQSPEPRRLDLPLPYVGGNIQLSPAGDQLLLFTVHEYALPRVTRMDIFPWVSLDSRRWIGFWAAAPDGRSATLMESIPDAVWDGWGSRGANPALMWHPAGDAFCLRIGTSLWLHAVEPPRAARK